MGVVDRDQFVTATGNAVSSLSAVFSSAVSSGSLLAVFTVYFNTGAQTFSTVTDNINNAGFTARILSTMVSDTAAHLIAHEKTTLSSGAAASTYRISVNYSAATNGSFAALLYKGSTFTFGSTGSSNGTSTGPRGPVQTASSSPVLFLSGAIHNSAGSLFVSTVASPLGTFVTTVDPSNANQVLNIVDSTVGTSLSQQLTHSLNASTRWLAGTLLYTGQTAAAGAGTIWMGNFALLGIQ